MTPSCVALAIGHRSVVVSQDGPDTAHVSRLDAKVGDSGRACGLAIEWASVMVHGDRPESPKSRSNRVTVSEYVFLLA